MEALPDLSGQNIRNYKLIRSLHRGGTAEVYLARDRRDKRHYALKILYPSDWNVSVFQQERAVFKILSKEPQCSEWVVCLHEAFVHEVQTFVEGKVVNRMHYYILVMELMTDDLFELLYGVPELDLPKRNPEFLIYVMFHLLEGLEMIHQHGLAHNDIKLENIFYKDSPRPSESLEALEVKYGDLGYTCTSSFYKEILGKKHLLLCDYNRGTLLSFSPEQAQEYLAGRSSSKISLRQAQTKDVWSLGVVFRLLTTDTYPFRTLTEFGLDPSFEDSEHREEVMRILTTEPLEPLVLDSGDSFFDETVSTVIEGMTLLNPKLRWTAEQAREYLEERISWEKEEYLEEIPS